MNKRILLLIVVVVFSTKLLSAQDRPAPKYLTIQEFPDSVNNTVLKSMNGKSTSLSDVLDSYIGKKVLVDFWASWCKDCLVSLPGYNKLRKKTESSDVAYLLLSVDKEDEKWKGAISRFNILGDHYRFDRGWKNPFSNYVDLDWIPRYIVLDEEGKIIEPKSIHIDDSSLFEILTDTRK
ncbi:TlpA family protein disulfide reductase [Reichenbachiella versicolor]|uniref:TlpA family protein disulfide reductase n=1 Tax=Reichenbachiella versicolor TaxID=1821036 RepID=UPI000D6EAD63|nr:TlpA disulfide reductase family protein [Reichenbachiella versicolor]